MNKLEKKIEDKLSEYIGFDIKEIINNDIDMAHVFGGAIRDIIADKEIHDVDILCMWESMRKLEPILIKNGYKIHKSLTSTDIQSMYSSVHVVVEPKTFIKIIDDEIRIIQLIRPGLSKMRKTPGFNFQNTQESISNFYYVLGQVDMSHCAVHYSHTFGLKESYYGAVNHCKIHVYDVLDTEMRTDRFHIRQLKFRERGWKEIKDIEKSQFERMMKLGNLINDDEPNYYLPTPGPVIRKYKEKSLNESIDKGLF